MIEVIRGESNKPVSSQKLIDYMVSRNDINGTLYIGYPIIGTIEGALNIDALLVTEQHGVVVFDIIEGIQLESSRQEIQDDAFTKLNSKFSQYTTLVKRRKLQVPIEVITFAPAVNSLLTNPEDNYIALNEDSLARLLGEFTWDELDEDPLLYSKLMAAVQAITTIKARPKRDKVTNVHSKGYKIQKLEESIANLDSTQSKAVIETVEGVQRIRGLAGSGKTIILALKVAYLHTKHPEWKIAVTFNTRALKNQFRELITRFTFEQKHEEPNWDNIKIIHAWGSPQIDGIYYQFCKEHNVDYLDFNTAKNIVNNYGKEFEYVCEKAINSVDLNNFKEVYDVILVDEAQDFSRYFLQICYNILSEPKRLIYAYDELQSLNKQSMASPEEIFGSDTDGKPRVTLRNDENAAKQDIILKQCYRNSRPILATAHALGFGIYREQGLVQLFENPRLWNDIGYELHHGRLKGNEHVILSRTDITSPKFLENHSPIEDIIKFQKFMSVSDQVKWIADEIEGNLKNDELEYKDIMVINCNPISTKNDVAPLRALLYQRGINSHLAGVNTSPDDFYDEDSITFTSIYRAKGNEAAMVYVMNAHYTADGYDILSKRNILFTAITRTKAWLRVTGTGSSMDKILLEFNKIKANDFKLDFTYPSEEERKKIKIINRDMNAQVKQRVRESKSKVDDILKDLSSGLLFKEDLSEEQLNKLKELLNNDN